MKHKIIIIMADLRTFASFKEYLLICLLGMLIYIGTNTWMVVNELAMKEAVREALYIEEQKWKAVVNADITELKKEKEESAKFRARVDDYIKPNEARLQRRTVER